MTSDTMSLSCQISCFPPDCIKQNIQQLGELLVQRKKKKSDKEHLFHLSFVSYLPKAQVLYLHLT